MKLSSESAQAALGVAAMLLLAPVCEASRSHHRLHQLLEKKHNHSHRHVFEDILHPISKRGGDCVFPTDPSLVAVTPGEMNGGWALSPDQSCQKDMYCPFACKPGMVMAQWDPDSTLSYPSSMNGGLYCDKSGKVSKPFPNKPYCVKGTGSVKAVNKAGSDMSFCQTVYPGNEAMLIPTVVSSTALLAVPDNSYWCETSAHFYVNPPGTGSEGCIWGTDSDAIGNWTPYVAGANTNSIGETYLKLGWNPEWEKSSLLKSSTPNYGLEIECPGGGCTGLPCGIDPTKGISKVQSLLAGAGDAGNNFCVVTISKGSEAQIVITSAGGSSSIKAEPKEEEEEEKEEPVIKIQAVPTTSSAPPTTSEPPQEPTTSSEPPPPPEPTTTSESSTTSTTSTISSTTPPPEPTTTSTSETPTPTTTWVEKTTEIEIETPTPTPTTVSKKSKPTAKPGIFHENAHNKTETDSDSETSTSSSELDLSTEATEEAAQSTEDEKENLGSRHQSSAAIGLVIAFAAAVCFF